MKSFKILLLWFLVIKLLTLPVFAGNNDSLPSNPYKGSGKETDLWNYSSAFEGIRISIYFAPGDNLMDVEKAFETGEGVWLIGKKMDITKTGPRFYVEAFTDYSVYDYMNRAERYTVIKTKEDTPYDYKDWKMSFVNTMPPVFNVTADMWDKWKEMWDNWFESPVNGKNTYKNIPQIAELVGASISADDFKKGIYNYRGELFKGQYRIFLSR